VRGCLNGILRGDQAQIWCNECGVLVRAVPAADLGRTLDQMELTLDVCAKNARTAMPSMLPGFSRLMVFTCENCGAAVRLGNDRDTDRLFGKE
jgi:hypothetical protein